MISMLKPKQIKKIDNGIGKLLKLLNIETV